MLVTRHSLVPSLMKVNLYTTIALRLSVMQFEYLAIIFLKFENYNFYICSQHSKANTNSKPSYCYKWNKQCLSKDFEYRKL